MIRPWLTIALALTLLHCAIRSGAADGPDFAFHIDEGVTAEDESYVREGLRLAEDYLHDEVGVKVDGTVNVNVRSSGAALNPGEIGEASNGYIAYFTESLGWTRSSPVFRFEVVVHEFVHVYQTDQLGPHHSAVPAWIMEGSAEYLASNALIETGLLSDRDADAFRFWTIAGASLDELADYEMHSTFRQADARVYGLSYLGIDLLVQEVGVGAIGDFFERVGRGNDWEDAFEAAFQATPSEFYRAFEQERRDSTQPVDLPEVYAEIDPVHSSSPVRVTDLPETVGAGEQLLMQARSEPNARCIAYLWGPSLDLAHETTVDGASNLFWLVTIPHETPAQSAEISVDCGAGAVLSTIVIDP